MSRVLCRQASINESKQYNKNDKYLDIFVFEVRDNKYIEFHSSFHCRAVSIVCVHFAQFTSTVTGFDFTPHAFFRFRSK